MEAHELRFLIDAAQLNVGNAKRAVQAEVERLMLSTVVQTQNHLATLRGHDYDVEADVVSPFLKSAGSMVP